MISKLDEETLRQIAKAGEGLYVRASNTDVGLGQLMDEVNAWRKQCWKNGFSAIMLKNTIFPACRVVFRVCGIYDSGQKE